MCIRDSPTLILRNILGFREDADGFTLAPTLPANLVIPGATYRVTNLRWRDVRFDLSLEVLPDGRLRVSATRQDRSAPFTLESGSGVLIADPSFEIANGEELRGKRG